MTFDILAAELSGDSAGRGYAGMTDEQAVASINAMANTFTSRGQQLGLPEVLAGDVARVRS